MTQQTNSTDSADMAEAATEMQDLTLRTMAVLSQLHERALKKASGSEYSLMDTQTLAKAYGTFWGDMLQNPGKLFDAQMKAGTAILSSWQAMLRDTGEEGRTAVSVTPIGTRTRYRASIATCSWRSKTRPMTCWKSFQKTSGIICASVSTPGRC